MLLLLVKKPTKNGKDPDYRPIGLQDQVGKLTFKSFMIPYQDLIYGYTAQFPHFGHTPARSHRGALRRVFQHCFHVMEECSLPWQVCVYLYLSPSPNEQVFIGAESFAVCVASRIFISTESSCVRIGRYVQPLLAVERCQLRVARSSSMSCVSVAVSAESLPVPDMPASIANRESDCQLLTGYSGFMFDLGGPCDAFADHDHDSGMFLRWMA